MTASSTVKVVVVMLLAISCGLPSFCCEASDESDGDATQDPDYAKGKTAIERKDWREASRRFASVALREPENANAQNFLGFAHRNLGELNLAFKYYRRALAIDPQHKGAHECIGETYLKINDLASAEKHLAELRRLCPLSCEPQEDLTREVAEYRAKTAAVRK